MKQSEQKQTAQMNRRRLVKAGMVVPPVIATLASRPVQAVQGLSNMASGDASVCRGDDRYGGQSPGFWKTPNGATDQGVGFFDAWEMTGYKWGSLIPGKQGNKWDHYTGGTPYSEPFGGDDTRSLREVLNEESGSDKFHWINGLLNAKYFEKMAAGSTTGYFMTTNQFWALKNGNMPIPAPYTSLRDLIESNQHKGPGSDCKSLDWNDDIVHPKKKGKGW